MSLRPAGVLVSVQCAAPCTAGRSLTSTRGLGMGRTVRSQFCPDKVKSHVQKQVISNSYQPGKDSMFYGGLSIILVLFLTLFVFPVFKVREHYLLILFNT